MDPKSRKKRFCFVYRTTNLTNGKYYIGCHCTFKLDDGYLGSGMRIQRAVAKYGRESFRLEVLQFFETREEALAHEKELVTEELLKDPMCMNVQIGGNGGWSASVGHDRQRHLIRTDPEWNERRKRKLSEAAKRRVKEKPETLKKFKFDWNGKHHSDETKAKQSQSAKGKHNGQLNSQFGKVWIRNGETSIKIHQSELEQHLQLGWVRGRKM